ncbi:MAG TPA: hypothetical protein DCX54_07800 [Flavobacteriales bacterium]|nr:hypothetical protein [Flavobacteriales bacterium]
MSANGKTNRRWLKTLSRKIDFGREKVYFLYCPVSNRVKIGKTRGVVSDRVNQIASTSSTGDKHILLFYMQDFVGGCEKTLHEKFIIQREHGEWFKQSGILEEFINNVLDEENGFFIELKDSLSEVIIVNKICKRKS